jgi:CMP-N-acetylneuraminic acid synthetase
MRHSSERVPGKNYRPFASRPLYHHIVCSLLGCPLIDEVVIDTDSPTIMDDAARVFPQVRLVERPEHLRAGTMPMNEVLLNDTKQVEADYYLQTHSTNPLLRTKTITQAIEQFLDALPAYDSLFGVTRLQVRLWDQLGRAVNHNPNILLRTQDLPPVYMENSNLYIFTRSILEHRHNRIGERPMMFEIDSIEAWDIDDGNSFRIAELLHHGLEKGPEETEKSRSFAP